MSNQPKLRRTVTIIWLAAALAILAIANHSALAAAAIPSFPGAEGFGGGATGGRGRAVYEVTNLNDDGPGSLRDAVSAGNRTVVFRVSGIIKLDKAIDIASPNVTVAGQTAPGDGITLRGHELFIKNTENIIVRFIRSRPGDEAKAELDAITVWNCKNVILDHCSMSWSTDSLNDVVKETGNVTVQWCILSEPLNNSVHIKGAHGYATGWDGRTNGGGSFHHNLIAHASSRAPRIGYLNTGRGLIDCRNNVIYNSGSSYGGETDDFNFVGNYYRPGPTTIQKWPHRKLFDLWSGDTKMYVADNVIEGGDAKATNESLISYQQGKNQDGTVREMPTPACLLKAPLAVAPVATQSAEEAYKLVLDHAGAILPNRDAVDERILKDVRDRTGGVINSQSDVGGWPELKSTAAPIDGDHDGMPDDWEKQNGLNPTDPSDGAAAQRAGGYTNLEIYINHLAEMAFVK